MLLSFDAQLMAAVQGDFTSESGKNKGTTYQFTTLKFNDSDGRDFQLSATGHISIDLASLRKDLHWDLEVIPKNSNGKTSFKVLKIAGSKIK